MISDNINAFSQLLINSLDEFKKDEKLLPKKELDKKIGEFIKKTFKTKLTPMSQAEIQKMFSKLKEEDLNNIIQIAEICLKSKAIINSKQLKKEIGTLKTVAERAASTLSTHISKIPKRLQDSLLTGVEPKVMMLIKEESAPRKMKLLEQFDSTLSPKELVEHYKNRGEAVVSLDLGKLNAPLKEMIMIIKFCPHLKNITVNGNKLSGAELMKCLNNIKSLEMIRFVENSNIGELLNFLAKAKIKTLKDVRVVSCNLRKENFECFKNLLDKYPKLESLVMRKCFDNVEDLNATLCKYIEKNDSKLKILYLNYITKKLLSIITKSQIEEIGFEIKPLVFDLNYNVLVNSKIKKIRIQLDDESRNNFFSYERGAVFEIQNRCNEITDFKNLESIRIPNFLFKGINFEKILKNNPDVKALDISNCVGLMINEKDFENTQIIELNVLDTNAGSIELNTICTKMPQMERLSIGPLNESEIFRLLQSENLKNIKYLDIKGKYTNEHAAELRNKIKNFPNLEHLVLHQPKIDESHKDLLERYVITLEIK